jgi:hypothetical protein
LDRYKEIAGRAYGNAYDAGYRAALRDILEVFESRSEAFKFYRVTLAKGLNLIREFRKDPEGLRALACGDADPILTDEGNWIIKPKHKEKSDEETETACKREETHRQGEKGNGTPDSAP